MNKKLPGPLATVTDQVASAANIVAIAKQREEMGSYNAELTSYLAKRDAIRTSFNTATANAEDALDSECESDFTQAAGEAAGKAFRTAVRAANQAYTSALKTLGAPPSKPKHHEDTRP